MEPPRLKLKPSAVLTSNQPKIPPPPPVVEPTIVIPEPPQPTHFQDHYEDDSIDENPVNNPPSKILLILDIIVICTSLSLGLYVLLYK